MTWEDFQTSTKSSEEEDTSYRQLRVSLVLHHQHRIQIVPLQEGTPVVVGRGRDTDVQLSDSMLSRRHARFEVTQGEVSVEDLHSTNGTELNGRPVNRSPVRTGDRVTLGSITASIHVLRPTATVPGVITHEQFRALLEEQVQRAKRRRTSLCLLMARAVARPAGAADGWYQEIRHLLGPNDRLAIHSPDLVELMLPTCTPERAQKVAETIASSARGEGGPAVSLCGIALYPEVAETAEGLLEALRRALQQASPAQPVCWAEPTAGETAPGSGLVATPTMHALLRTIRKVARSTIPVLICGDTGTGKEVVARAIHEESGRRAGRLLCVNCGAIPQSLIESELFGHERGSFTGADRQAKGIFEEAGGGTVLLDEIGELSPAAQAALLRVLETKTITRVGSSHPISINVRILAATHRDLEAMCDEGTFRLDLLHRLNTMTLRVPPLRERREEIEPLAANFLRQANSANGCSVEAISPEVVALLRQYHWPGNVRELRNVIDHAVVVAGEGVINVGHLPERILAGATRRRYPSETGTDTAERFAARTMEPDPRPGTGEEDAVEDAAERTVVRQSSSVLSFRHHLRQIESALIGEALQACAWSKIEAASQLRMPLRTLKEKVRVYRIDRTRHDPRQAAGLIAGFLRIVSRWPGAVGHGGGDDGGEPLDFKERIRRYEAVQVLDALADAAGNKAEAARRLGMPLRTLKEKCRNEALDRIYADPALKQR